MESGGEDRSDLSAREPTEYERLVRFVAAPAKRFALAIARYVDARVRDEVITRAREDVMTAGGVLAVLDARSIGATGDLVHELRSTIAGFMNESRPRAICVVNLEPLFLSPAGTPQTAPSIEGLNRRRDELPSLIQAHIVLWVRDEAAAALAMAARDLLDIALTYFRFNEAGANERALHRYNEVPFWMNLADASDAPRLKREAALLSQVADDPSTTPRSRADALARIGQIEILRGNPGGIVRLKDAADQYAAVGDDLAEARLRVRIGDWSRFTGAYEEGLASYDAAEANYGRIGDRRGQAIAKSGVAEIMLSQGNTGEAHRILADECLPIVRELSDRRDLAVTLAKIASVQMNSGQLDEALRMIREQVLPAFDKLGDVRNRAIALSNVAVILEKRGQLEEAMSLWRDETLPIFEQIGDKRAASIARMKIANSLLERNHEGDREEARGFLRQALTDAESMSLSETSLIRGLLEKT